MARQVLTIPDVPPTLLQKTTADSLYATVGHNHNAAYVAKGGDTMTGALTLTPGDGLVALTANVRSGEYFLRQANLEDLFMKTTGRGLHE